jgi:hypothetical protein
MKTSSIVLITLFAATPAGASLNTSDSTPFAVAPQPAAYRSEPHPVPDTTCAKPRKMIFILRDPSGSIVAMGVAQVPATC